MHRNHHIVAPTSVHRITTRIPAFTTCHFHRNKPWRNIQQPLPSYGVFAHPFSLQTTASTPHHDEPSVRGSLVSTLIRRGKNLDDDPFGFADDDNANDDGEVNDEYGDFGDGAEGNRFTLADESEITDEMVRDVEGSKPSELMIMKDLLGINIFTYVLAALIVLFLSLNLILGPGWLGQQIGFAGTGTFTQISDSLPDSVDLSGAENLL